MIKIYLCMIPVCFSTEFLSKAGITSINSFEFLFQLTHDELGNFQTSYDKLAKTQKSNYSVLILLHLRHIVVKNSKKKSCYFTLQLIVKARNQ